MPPFSTQFSVSLELAKLLPARAAVNYTAESILGFARELRRSGSDILVEEDLAAIFARGKIVPSVENHFRDVVKIASFAPLHAGSEIILDAGPGPTVRRGLKDRHYMSTVIQLSCLGFLHDSTTLAASLADSMHKRYELGIQGATPDPHYDGILATLLACTSQTSQYPWELLVSLVEHRFEKSAQWFRRHRSPLKRLSPNILLGAMDYLYLVQSLPEDRIMMVENQMGLVPIVVWAHCILGLTVLVKGSPDGDVAFGKSRNPQVIINWSHEWELDKYTWEVKDLSTPGIYLLDGNMDVVLKTGASDDESVKIEGEERLRLRGYGTTFLRRLFNMESIIVDDDPIYAEVVQFTVAFAIVVSKFMRRVPLPRRDKQFEVPEQCYGRTEYWRIMASSESLFSGFTLDKKEIGHYVKQLVGVQTTEMAVPPTLRRHLEKVENGYRSYNKESFISDVKRMTLWILAFAQVVDLEACADMPLRYDPPGMLCYEVMKWEGIKPIDIDPEFWFVLVVQLMIGETELNIHVGTGEGLFLFSHHGWSLFYNTIGDKDPGKVNCELLSIKRGVPTSTRTNERKYQISDAPRIRPKGQIRAPMIIDNRDSYLPRCVSPVVKRTECYSSRGRGFLLTIRYDIDESGTRLRAGEEAKFSIYASYAEFHKGLWGVVKTLACPHPKDSNKPVKLDLGVTTAKGFPWASGEVNGDPRICISLVKSDPRARWLTINGIVENDKKDLDELHDALGRRVMLRCDDCCEDCAVQAASMMNGKWLVIL